MVRGDEMREEVKCQVYSYVSLRGGDRWKTAEVQGNLKVINGLRGDKARSLRGSFSIPVIRLLLEYSRRKNDSLRVPIALIGTTRNGLYGKQEVGFVFLCQGIFVVGQYYPRAKTLILSMICW